MIISLAVFLVIFGVLIVIHEFGHFITAKKLGVRVERFSLGFGRALFSRKSAGTEYSINAIPFGGYVKLAGDTPEERKGLPDEYLSQSIGARAAIIFCGPLLNYILGFLCFWLIFFAGYPTMTTRVGGLLDDYGAKEAGIKPGDTIISVSGNKVAYWEDLQKLIQEQKDAGVVKFSVLRDGKEMDLNVKIKKKEMTDLIGTKTSIGLVGITSGDEVVKVRHGFWQSCGLGAEKTLSLTAMTYKALWRMITGKLSFRESVSGPLGIFYITSKAAQLGIIAVLHLVAVLNISVAIFNLLPLPVLDGGHLALLVLEKIRRRPLNIKVEQALTRIGFALIITLAITVTYFETVRFFGERIAKFFIK